MTTMATINQRGRKPAQLELVGGKSSRQRIWEVIRKTEGKAFEMSDIAHTANVDDETLKTYLHCLRKGGFTEIVSQKRFGKTTWKLIKNTGIHAPRLDRKGNPVKQGLASEGMWTALRRLGELDASQLVSHVQAGGVDVTIAYAKRYIGSLRKAGYLQTIVPGGAHRLERFRLKPSMNTGPRPPQVQNVKTVYDPNLNKVMHCEDPQEAL